MGGQSDKKIAKYAEETIQYYFFGMVGVTIMYFFGRFIWNLSVWEILYFCFFSLISKVTYGAIASALKLGVPFSYYQDVFVINLATQGFIVLTDYGWLLYLSVPGYLCYQLALLLHFYIFTPKAGEVRETEEEKKRREKKERQADRPKFKTGRR
eukprot:GEMP01045542.1.p1 GENE.GEMP01045542.1~~GEMP01045542.1.p1  ORF type:complete len:154 (+),score=32.15 GEMP01045542.1:170-631(+)